MKRESSKETVVLRRLGNEWVAKDNLALSTKLIMQIGYRVPKADVSNVSPSSERIMGLWVVCSL